MLRAWTSGRWGHGCDLYAGPGQRRILPPIVFGLGVLWHLSRHGRRYDVVHTCSFPYFSLLAIALLAPLHSYRVVVDWFEVWSRSYWRSYLGRRAATSGGRCSGCARAFRSMRSASRGSTPGACARRGCAVEITMLGGRIRRLAGASSGV